MKKQNNSIFSKKKISTNKQEKNIIIDKWDFEAIETKNKLLETKLKRTELTIKHLYTIKPCILFHKKRKQWDTRIKKIISEREEIINELQNTHIELENIIPEKEEDNH